MVSHYFQQELSNLRKRGAEFGEKHPSLAPMLNGAQADPDVERLLEGTAFLTATLKQKLDDEFPEIVHDLLQVVAPHYLQPLPAATIQAFRPKATVKQSFMLPAGIYCASVPVDGTSCLFRTCYEAEIHPLSIIDASMVQPPGRPSVVKIVFELNGLSLAQWKPKRLRLYLADEFSKATDLYFLLRKHVSRIRLVPQTEGPSYALDCSHLCPVGFEPKEGLIPYPSQAYPGFSVLQEYFMLPQKFLFLDLVGLEQWKERGTGSRFEVHFECAAQQPPVRVSRESFVLHATPAVNVFPHAADPIDLNHLNVEYRIRPSELTMDHLEVFSVDEVKGYGQGTCEERTYKPFEAFRHGSVEAPLYHVKRSNSLDGKGVDYSLSVTYDSETQMPAPETLSVRLSCTNGALPRRLKAGDISVHGEGCPEYVTFTNLLPPCPSAVPRIGKKLLWKLLSHLSISFQSLQNPQTLKSLLDLYVISESEDHAAIANHRRIQGIVDVKAEPEDRILSGMVMRGRKVTISYRRSHFAGRGDAFLFGSVLDLLFGHYASINSFIRLVMKDTEGGGTQSWSPRTGNRTLI